MSVRSVVSGALLLANLAVLVATSSSSFSVSSEPTAPIAFELDPDARTTLIEVEITVDRALARTSLVKLDLSLAGENAANTSGVLKVYDLADPADPLESTVASTTIAGALGDEPAPFDDLLSFEITEAGPATHFLVLELEGDAELAGEIVLVAHAETEAEPEGGITVEVR